MNQNNDKNKRREKRVMARRATVVIGLLSVSGALLAGATFRRNVLEAGGPTVMLARYSANGQEAGQNVGTDADSEFAVVASSRIDVNTLQSVSASESSDAVRRNVIALLASSGRSAPEWTPSDAPVVETRIVSGTDATSDSLAVYALRNQDGAQVWVINRSPRRIETNVRIRLPRGVYKIERLTLGPDRRIADATASFAAPAGTRLVTHGLARPLSPAHLQAESHTGSEMVSGRLERMQGADLVSANVVAKRYTLEPGQACIYRYADQACIAGRAWYAVYDRLHRLAASKPAPARRLRRMMQEAEGNLAGLRGGSAPKRRSRRNQGASGRLASIHRLLLVTGQAEALARNLHTRGVFPKEAGRALMAELARLSESLSESSATLLGLVPVISVTSTVTGRDMESGTLAQPPCVVTVALANTGGASVDSVKLGLDAASLPNGTVMRPSDPAFVGVLRPGQTARATFSLRNLPVTNNANAESCIGDVSYFKAGTPAHLRPRSF